MDKNTHTEIIIAVIFLGLLILFLNPFNLWMPERLAYIMIGSLVVLFALFASFVWRENAHDEREQQHKQMAGRVAYLAGASVLILGIVIQSITTHVDPWLVLALGAMVLGKVVMHIYNRTHN